MILNVYDFSKSQSMSVIMCDWSQLVDVGGLFFRAVFLSTTGRLVMAVMESNTAIEFNNETCLFHMAI